MEKKMANPIFAVETEQKIEPAAFVASLGNFGLGHDNGGITSNLIETEYDRYSDDIANALVAIEDNEHVACIDGRCTTCQIDGSRPVARKRIAGAILSYDVAALVSKGSLEQSLAAADSIYKKLADIEKFAKDTMGLAPSSHSGGCGAANGLINHLRVMNSENIAAATAAIIQLIEPAIQAEYDNNIYQEIAANADTLALQIEQANWDGNKFVASISEQDQAGVEQLEADKNDQYHGHKEQSIILVYGNKTLSKQKMIELGLGQAFVINIDLINDIAASLSGLEGQAGYSKALHALIAYQLAVASNLCNKNMPVFII
jgi:hypothetical protein